MRDLRLALVFALFVDGCSRPAPQGGVADSPESPSRTAHAPGDSTAPRPSDSAFIIPPDDTAKRGIVGIEWSASELAGGAIAVPSGGGVPRLRLDDEGRTFAASGMAGCNRFRGTATLAGDSLRFGPLMATRMACPALELERRFLAALDSVRTYRVERGSLLLLSGDRPLVRLTRP